MKMINRSMVNTELTPGQHAIETVQVYANELSGYDLDLAVYDNITERLRMTDTIRKDDQVWACMQQRISAVVQSELVIEPGGDSAIDKSATDYAIEFIDNLPFDDITSKMLWATLYGWSVSEIIPVIDGRYYFADKIKVKSRGRFRFHEKDGELIYYRENSGNYERLPQDKFWTMTSGGITHDNPYGYGLSGVLFNPVKFRHSVTGYALIFLDKFSLPFTITTVPEGKYMDKEFITEVKKRLRTIAKDSGIVVPDTANTEFIDLSKGVSGGYTDFLNRLDRIISKVILSQSMTTEDGSSRAQAEVHQDVALHVKKSDSDLLSRSFSDGPLKTFVELNFKGANLPKVWRKIETEDNGLQKAQRDKVIFDMGYRPSLEYVHEVYDSRFEEKTNSQQTPETTNGNGLLPEQLVDGQTENFAESNYLLDELTRQRVDQQVLKQAAVLLADQYKELLGNRIDQLIAQAQETGDLYQFREAIQNEILNPNPPKRVIDSVERANTTARLMGYIRGERAN